MKNDSNLKEKTVSSIVWKLMERIVAQSISLLVSIVIARLLSPNDYGIVGFVVIFFSFADVIISSGLNTALIQKQDSDEKDYSSVFWLSLLLSILSFIVLYCFAPVIAKYYKQELLIKIIRVMGMILPVYAAKSIVCAYISASLQFRKFFLATIGGTLISGIVGIWMAVEGYGAWALVVQQITNTIVDTTILYASTRLRIRCYFSLHKVAKLFRYGWKILISSLINTLYIEIRPLVIGIRFSAADLSYYSKGNSFPNLISTTTTNTLSAVLFPVLSKFQEDKRALLNYTRRFIKIASFFVFPLMIGMAAIADNFVVVLLTEKWLETSYYIKIFAISSMFSMINIGNCETIKAMGRSDVFLVMEIIKKSCYTIIIGLYIIFGSSARQLALASILCTAVAIIVNTVPNRQLISYKYKDQLMDILPNMISALIMGVVVLFVGRLKINIYLLLLCQILIGIVVYLTVCICTKNENIWYCKNSIINLLKNHK